MRIIIPHHPNGGLLGRPEATDTDSGMDCAGFASQRLDCAGVASQHLDRAGFASQHLDCAGFASQHLDFSSDLIN